MNNKKHLISNTQTNETYEPKIFVMDIGDLDSIPSKAEEMIKLHGHIDILINNAGISMRAEAVDIDLQIDIKMMNVNYFGAVALTKAILPSMIDRKEGRIVFVGSIQGKFGVPNRSAYGASKHALQAFSESLRAEVARHNVKVTIICPGCINTNISKNALTSSGEPYGKTDDATLAGLDPDKLARDVKKCILNNDDDVYFGNFFENVAWRLHYYLPNIYFWVMSKRADKLAKSNL